VVCCGPGQRAFLVSGPLRPVYQLPLRPTTTPVGSTDSSTVHEPLDRRHAAVDEVAQPGMKEERREGQSRQRPAYLAELGDTDRPDVLAGRRGPGRIVPGDQPP
jgi:hypothetical protein